MCFISRKSISRTKHNQTHTQSVFFRFLNLEKKKIVFGRFFRIFQLNQPRPQGENSEKQKHYCFYLRPNGQLPPPSNSLFLLFGFSQFGSVLDLPLNFRVPSTRLKGERNTDERKKKQIIIINSQNYLCAARLCSNRRNERNEYPFVFFFWIESWLIWPHKRKFIVNTINNFINRIQSERVNRVSRRDKVSLTKELKLSTSSRSSSGCLRFSPELEIPSASTSFN